MEIKCKIFEKMNVKKIVKKSVESFLLKSLYAEKIARLYGRNNLDDFGVYFLNSALIRGNIWLYTQMKSGTTVLCNTLAFYNAKLLGEKDYDFDSIEKQGVYRIVSSYLSFSNYISYVKKYEKGKVFLQTHEYYDSEYDKAILLTRNPYDYFVSSYHFHYKNRASKKKKSISVEKAIPVIIQKYSMTHKMQNKVYKDNPLKCKMVSYEDLMCDKFSVIKDIILFVYDDCYDNILMESLQESDADQLIKYEKKVGQAIVAADDYNVSHFIRSGKVGEYKDFLTEKQICMIEDELIKNNISDVKINSVG